MIEDNFIEEIWEKFKGHCAFCGTYCGVHKNNSTINFDVETLYPICSPCKIQKGNSDLKDFRKEMMDMHNKIAVDKDFLTHLVVRWGIVEIKPFDGVFYFEKEVAE